MADYQCYCLEPKKDSSYEHGVIDALKFSTDIIKKHWNSMYAVYSAYNEILINYYNHIKNLKELKDNES